MFKKILWALLALLIIIQFFRPAKNKATGPQPNAIANLHPIPADAQVILKKACNDCHSNNTEYPWYSKIQPVAWWLDNHIRDGKKELNFDEYTNKSARYQYHKMEEMIEMVKEKKMPISSYTWTHKDAKLTDAERTTLVNWAESVMGELKTRYPIDSLIRKK